jgi:hypothetical protein
MANKNFVVHNGLTVGPLTIDAATGDINTSGNVNISGSVGVSQIAKNDSFISINDTGTSSSVVIQIDGNTEHTINEFGVDLAVNNRYAIDGNSVLTATALGNNVVDSSLTTLGNLTALSVAGPATVYGNLTVQGLTTLNGGTLTLGDSNTDNVVFGADINSSIIPNTSNTFELGSADYRWNAVYALAGNFSGNLSAGNLSASNIVGTLLTADQPNITAVGNLISLAASGTIRTTGVVWGNTGIGGTLLTASQPNITAVGNLTALSASGTIETTGVLYANSNIASSSTTTGATVIKGGLGVSGDAYIGSAVYMAGARVATADEATALAIALG